MKATKTNSSMHMTGTLKDITGCIALMAVVHDENKTVKNALQATGRVNRHELSV